jgi:hypothetical protein
MTCFDVNRERNNQIQAHHIQHLEFAFTAQKAMAWDNRHEPSQHPTSQQELHLPNQLIINNTSSL